QNASVVLDRLDRTNVVVITGHQHTVEAEPVVGELQGQPKHRRRVSLSSEFGNHDIADVTAYAVEKVVEHMTNRHAPDDSFAVKGKEECGWNVIRRKIHAPLPLFEDFEVATEGHPLFVIVKEIRYIRCRRMVCPHELVCFLDPWQAKHQRLW